MKRLKKLENGRAVDMSFCEKLVDHFQPLEPTPRDFMPSLQSHDVSVLGPLVMEKRKFTYFALQGFGLHELHLVRVCDRGLPMPTFDASKVFANVECSLRQSHETPD